MYQPRKPKPILKHESVLQDSKGRDVAVYNERNKLITANDIQMMWRRYISPKYIPIDDRALAVFRQALTHRSYVYGIVTGTGGGKIKKSDAVVRAVDLKRPSDAVVELQDESYERLEFLGDGVVHAILAKYIFCRFKDKDEGFMTRLRSKIEKGKTMATIARTLGIGKWILISKDLEFAGKRDDDAILEDSFEALMGAFCLVHGYSICQKIIYNIVNKDVDIASLLYYDDNYKDQLLRFYQQLGWPDPVYMQDASKIEKEFRIYVIDGRGKKVGWGSGLVKKDAEQLAAKRTLEYFKLVEKDGKALMNLQDMDTIVKAYKVDFNDDDVKPRKSAMVIDVEKEDKKDDDASDEESEEDKSSKFKPSVDLSSDSSSEDEKEKKKSKKIAKPKFTKSESSDTDASDSESVKKSKKVRSRKKTDSS